jgi:periplasmic protein TonB
MAQVTHMSPNPVSDFLFQSLNVVRPVPGTASKGLTLAVSATVHGLLVAAIVLVPLFFYDAIPQPSESIMKAFFVSPVEIAPAPPPPPPPAPAIRAAIKAPVPVPVPVALPTFVAPIEVPEGIRAPESIDLGFGVEGGVPGGVEGGVPGGVVGGIVGGAMPLAAPPPAKFVRVGGNIVTPKILKKVAPEYPELARASRLGAIIIVEAQVDTRGLVQSVSVLRGHPLFDEPAAAAVKQWRYRPLLLNGQPTPFIVTITLTFAIQTG